MGIYSITEITHQGVYDPIRKQVIVFSPLGNPLEKDSVHKGTVYSYSPSQDRWDSLGSWPYITNYYPQVEWNSILQKCVVLSEETGIVLSFDPATRQWDTLSESTSYSLNKTGPRHGFSHDPYTNVYICTTPGGGGHYHPLTYLMRDSIRTPLERPNLARRSYSVSSNWKTLGTSLSNVPNGYAHNPVIKTHRGELYLAWTEYGINWNSYGGASLCIYKLSNNEWQSIAKVNRAQWHQYVSLTSDTAGLLIGDDACSYTAQSRSGVYVIRDNAFDSVGLQDFWGSGSSGTSYIRRSMPVPFRYKGKLHALNMGKQFRDWDSPRF